MDFVQLSSEFVVGSNNQIKACHNIGCILIEIHYEELTTLTPRKPQTRLYKQRNKRSWEIRSIADKEREENCFGEKHFKTTE